jgi:hypothetical protein
MLSQNTIQRLADIHPDDYLDALAILFINYAKFPRMNVEFGHERAVLIEVVNESPEALRIIKTANRKFELYVKEKLNFHFSNLKDESKKSNERISELLASITDASINQILKQEFMLVDQYLKSGIIARILDTALTKYEQQGRSFINTEAFKLLSDPNLRLIELWEQASICHKCPNFERIVSTYPLRESKCLKCGQDSLTARIYVLDQDFESHKKKNKDLALYICELINRKEKGAAVTSKSLNDFENSHVEGDIDVWIEKTLTGIECKLPIFDTKLTDGQFKTHCDYIEKDLRKYIEVGVKNLVVVTNLYKDDASKLHKSLHDLVGKQCNSLRVLHRSIHDLHKMVSEQTEAIRKLSD